MGWSQQTDTAAAAVERDADARGVEYQLDHGTDTELSFDVGCWAPAGLSAKRALTFQLTGRFNDVK